MVHVTLHLDELDAAGGLCRTFVQSRAKRAVNPAEEVRVDVVVSCIFALHMLAHRPLTYSPPPSSGLQVPPTSKTSWQKVLDAFLPAGYPHSVTDDYIQFVANPHTRSGYVAR